MGEPTWDKTSFPPVKAWQDLIETAARQINTTEPKELRAELARKLLRLARDPPSGVSNWEAFLRTALKRKALNWIRDQQARQEKLLLPNAPRDDDDESDWIDGFAARSPNQDQALAYSIVRDSLEPKLRLVWDLIWDDGLNQTEIGERLGLHRNTVRAMCHKIRAVLVAHRLEPTDHFPQ
ncbi:MAG: hypothetical protein C5B51_13640 [Terriglobia bacterium]|nr:MAG: hypothetical protein C5B51_13640 [Terriglobia bacterium]